MPDPLSSVDATFLYLEDSSPALHAGGVLVFDTPEEGFDYETLLTLVANRIAYVPRYRQRIRMVPAGLAGPVWVDDADFDLTYHVRRAQLPRPGTDRQLADFAARVGQRLLDRDRPLWEMYLVEGLSDGRFALVTKTHQAMVDGVTGIDLAQVILDDHPAEVVPIATTWQPTPAPSSAELLARSAWDTVSSPRRWWTRVQTGVDEVRRTAGVVARTAGQAAGTLLRSATSPAPQSPLNTSLGTGRRAHFMDVDLADFQTVRERRSGSIDRTHVTVHDVVLAVLAGAMREWLLARGEPVTSSTTLRAMVPVSVVDAAVDSHVGGPVVAAFVDLPVGEPNASMRLHQVSYRMAHQVGRGNAASARGLAGLAGFAPSTLHSLAARAATAMSRRVFNLMISNVPGPQRPRFAGQARMVATYPLIPLVSDHALAIGLTSYEGRIHLGLHADRSAMPDLDELVAGVETALADLMDPSL